MKYEEDNLLMAVVSYLRLQYPHILFTHIANERKASPQAGARLKKKGVVAGFPDLLIFQYSKRGYNGCAIELKIHPNKPTDSQKAVGKKLQDCLWQWYVCYTFEEAKKVIDNYLK